MATARALLVRLLQLCPLVVLAAGACGEGGAGVAAGAAPAVEPPPGLLELPAERERIAAVPPEEDGLPVFHLQTVAPLSAEAYGRATVTYRGRAWEAEAKHHGRSSLTYPKKSFTLKFPRGDLFSASDRGEAFRERRKVLLVSTFDDASYLRHRLAYTLWNRIGTIRLQTFSAVVYVDGAYQGLYTVVDHVDEDLLAAQGFAGGNLYKAVDHAADFRAKAALTEGFELEDGSPAAGEPGAFEDLAALVRFVAGADDARFSAEIGRAVHVDDYVGWMVLSTTLAATDSLAKNSYHLHDRRRGSWRAIPWDFNASFGQGWDTRRLPPDEDPLALARTWNGLFERLLRDPTHGPAARARFRRLLDEELASDAVLGAFDEMTGEIAAAARRDEAHWGAAHRSFFVWGDRTDFADFDGEIAYLRRWIEARWRFLRGASGPLAR